MKEENLIFIISQPRSGSTYLQNLLSNNDKVNTCSEPWLLLNYANQIKPDLVKTVFNNKWALNAFDEYKTKFLNSDFEIEQKRYLLSLYGPMAKGFQFVIDKTPRYWEILDEILSLFPKSKIIILKRNPIDVIKSIIKTWQITTLVELNKYRRDILIAPFKFDEFCRGQRDNVNVYQLKYEDLVGQTNIEVGKLYRWIGLNFDPRVLEVSKNKKFKGNYGDPYQNSNVSYWELKKISEKNEISSKFSKFIEGYTLFLGSNFLNEYGNYKIEVISKHNTKEFLYFLHLGQGRNIRYGVKKQIKYLCKEFYFRFLLRL